MGWSRNEVNELIAKHDILCRVSNGSDLISERYDFEAIKEIRKGLADITKALRDIEKGIIYEGIGDVKEGIRNTEEGLRDIIWAVNNIF